MPPKNYLTNEYIKYINERACDPIWRMGALAALKQNWYDILLVSQTGLIHFHGNGDTGWEHILNRHSYYSFANQFGKGAQANPSKFTGSSIPIHDFVNVADDIYANGKVDLKPHTEGEMFIKYQGKSFRFVGSNGETRDFNLILYRGTKIVHSLYPKKDIEGNRPKKILENLSRDQNLTSAEKILVSEILTVRLPYINRNNIQRYIIILRINLNTQRGNIHIQTNLPNGDPYFCTSKVMEFGAKLTFMEVHTGSIEFTRFLNGLGLTDLTAIEKVIKDIEKQVFSQIA